MSKESGLRAGQDQEEDVDAEMQKPLLLKGGFCI